MSSQLFLLSLADIFSVYPKIFNAIIAAEEQRRSVEGALAKDFIYLPSDADWQEKVYYRLLDVQKRLNQAIESGLNPDDVIKRTEKPIWDLAYSHREDTPTTSPSGFWIRKRKCVTNYSVNFAELNLLSCWNIDNIAKAGKLLRKPAIPVLFNDEHEMRKVYSLIYDVFRYKHVMSQALNDICFFAHYPQLSDDSYRVWLILFDLHGRHFQKRVPEDAELEKILYKEADLATIAKCLWQQRVQLAAAISRLRIKSGALHLSELLPNHLQNEKVAIAASNPLITGWMNPFKLKDKAAAEVVLKQLGLKEVKDADDGTEKPLGINHYKWDKTCPLFLSCIPGDRSAFAQSGIVKKNLFILQDRTFSLAPAIISRLLDFFDLEGDVVQTHVSSPRSTAYLAALFHSVNRVHDFLAFGAGENLPEYKQYLHELGAKNVRFYTQGFCSLTLESPILETVVGVFATPPNSYSGVTDPIDLICSRGGDLSMLEVLTESEISQEGQKRVAQILEEQRDTLRLSMSRPQVQFILYETHSIVGSENQDMVNRAVEDINRCAFEKHLAAYKEKKRLEALAELEACGFPGASLTQTASQRRSAKSEETKRSDEAAKLKKRTDSNDSLVTNDSVEDLSQIVQVPKTDEFLVADVPDMCLNRDKCVNFGSLGCYVSLIRRKKVTKLDAKYLIKMAEQRGLFGSTDQKKSAKSKSAKRQEKRPPKGDGADIESKRSRNKKADIASLIERLNTPTHASLQKYSTHTLGQETNNNNKKTCNRHRKHHAREYPYTDAANPYFASLHLDSRAKRWWRETTNHINSLRQIHNAHNKCSELLKLENIIVEAPSPELCTITPNLPPFQLSRNNNILHVSSPQKAKKWKSADRIPYPVSINQLEFKGFRFSPTNNIRDFINNTTSGQKPNSYQTLTLSRSYHHPKPLGQYAAFK